MSLPEARYGSPLKQAAWYADSLNRLRSLPGVTHAEITGALPYSDNGWVQDCTIENRPVVPGKDQSAIRLPVSDGYFAAFHIPIVAGRGFSRSDAPETLPVAVVSQRFVDQYFPDQNPIGHRIRMGELHTSQTPWLTIVGVAQETSYTLMDPTHAPAVYMDAVQVPSADTFYAVMTDGNPMAVATPARVALAEIDPALPLDADETWDQLIHEQLTGLIDAAVFLLLDACIALLLAAIGIFGVMANLVGERTREIGVRLAMGARREDVMAMILRRASWLTAIGLGTGLLMAFGLAHLVANLLRGVSPNDPVVFAVITALIATNALGSSWVPARRASRVDPIQALRSE